MQKFHMDFYADSKGLYYYNLVLKALNNEHVKDAYDYSVEHDLPCTEHHSGKMHRVTWWRRREAGVQR